ncbi:hypothetical protein QFZ29_000099 [Agromyces albus]|nr:hypothetical protein [Agromyces albus]
MGGVYGVTITAYAQDHTTSVAYRLEIVRSDQ